MIDLEALKHLLGLQHVEMKISPKWGSSVEGFRESLYSELPVGASSISHTANLGGFIFTQDPGVQLGFDIEQIWRVTDVIAKRICHEESEFIAAPSAAALWSAKEACFKSLRGPLQPKVISEITVGQWLVSENFPDFTTYHLAHMDSRSQFHNVGTVTLDETFVFAFFVLSLPTNVPT